MNAIAASSSTSRIVARFKDISELRSPKGDVLATVRRIPLLIRA
jgi:hypothetical protein